MLKLCISKMSRGRTLHCIYNMLRVRKLNEIFETQVLYYKFKYVSKY